VKSALIADLDVKGTQVKVEVNRGIVQLSGFVDSAAQAQRAVTVARNVQGVSEVRNSLIVK
jgi:hyperosmotically inducible protein